MSDNSTIENPMRPWAVCARYCNEWMKMQGEVGAMPQHLIASDASRAYREIEFLRAENARLKNLLAVAKTWVESGSVIGSEYGHCDQWMEDCENELEEKRCAK